MSSLANSKAGRSLFRSSGVSSVLVSCALLPSCELSAHAVHAVDIKELKLLGGFDHPNIVRFVCLRMFLLCIFFLTVVPPQLGVSIPEDTRATPVMIVSELCSNGDLFDYVRNVNPPTLHKVVCILGPMMQFPRLTFLIRSC